MKFQTLAGALAGGCTTAMVQMPLDAIYGTLAFASLGPAYASMAVASALVGSVVAHAAATLAGSRHLVLGPRASTALLVAGLIPALMAQSTSQAATQPVPQVLALVALGLVMAGVLQVVFGRLGLGTLTRYLPYPVRAGFLNGVGALLALSGLRMLLGLVAATHPAQSGGFIGNFAHDVQGGAVAVGLVTIAATLASARYRALAAPIGLACGIALHHSLAAIAPALPLGPTLAVANASLVEFDMASQWLRLGTGPSTLALLPVLLGFAFAVALLASLDTFLTGSVMDSVLRRRSDGNRELIAQGVSNVATALVGGLPSAPGIARSLLIVQAGGRTQWAIGVYVAIVAATVAFVPGILHLIPVSAVGGALVVVGWQMVDEWSRRVPGQLRRGAVLDPRQRRTLIENYLVMLLVAGTLIVVGLAEGIVFGVIAAMVLFVRSNSHALVRQVMRGNVRRSVKVRAPSAAGALERDGTRIALLELEGNVFFGTSDELADRVRKIALDADYLILSMRRVTDIDGTGARTLLELANDLGDAGKWLLIADLGPQDARTQTIHAMRGASPAELPEDEVHLSGLRFEPDIDMALQWAEDRLLEGLGLAQADGSPLALDQTVLGSGLSSVDLAWLREQMSERRFARGEHLFRAGDAGDALYISTQGEISILLPGGAQKRLASFAPGVVVGELALLQGVRRTADAIAESDLTVLRLERDAFDRIRATRPDLWDSLMRNLTQHLAARLRSVTVELSAALEP